MRFKKWFIVFYLCLIPFVVHATNQEKFEISQYFHAIAEKAAQGDAEAQFSLGAMYFNGKEVAQNDIEAVKWFRKAAEQGHTSAQYVLGWMYYNSKRVTQNKIEAIKWFRKAAEQGNVNAQLYLGLMYYDQNDIEAAKWFRKAAKQGHAQAQFILGRMCANGKGVTRNDIEATKWFRKAGEQGHAGAFGTLGKILITQGKFDEAQSVTEKAHEMESHNFAWIINLGHTYLLKGNRKTARRYYQKALLLISDETSFEQGPIADFELFIKKGWQVKACRSELEWIRLAFKQLKLAETYNSQVIQYYQQGQFKQALPLAEQAYHLRKEVLGERHLDTLLSLNDLAEIYRNLGRLSKALLLHKKAYRLFKDVLGEKDPNTLLSLNNLAGIYRDLGRLSKALLLFEKVYRFRKEVLGEEHPDTLTSLNNLAIIYQDLSRFSEALPLFEKAYRLSSEVLGEKHPDTLTSLGNLAETYRNLGRLSKALPLFEKVYRFRKEVLGEKHPDTLLSLNNLATIYKDSGGLSGALLLFEKSYRLHKDELGEKHLKTLISLHNLAGFYRDSDRLSEALPLSEKAYHFRKEVLGEKHPDTLTSLNNLAFAYEDQGQTQKATKHFEKFVAGVETLRSGDLSAENRQALFKKWVPVYFWLSFLYITEFRPHDAFRLAEMSKARTLLESLAAKLAASLSGLTTAEQQQLQNYEARLAFLNNRIAKTLENNQLEERITLETEKNQRVSQLNQFHRELMAKYPKYARLNEVQIIGAKEGAKYLPEDTVLISYLVNENHVLAFTLLPDSTLTAYDLGKISHLSDKLDCYQYQVSQGRGPVSLKSKTCTNMESVSRELGKILLEPLFEQIKDQTHWIISPNGPLALIPFEALFWNGEPQPIVAQYQMSYVQSLSVLKLLRERETAYTHLENRGVLLAMGAPLYKATGTAKNKGNPSIVDFKIARQMVRRGGDYTGAFEQLGSIWPDLPGALTELEQLEKLFKETQPRIYKQASATEAKLQDLNQQGILAQYRYLVFSTHGHLNLQIPELSSIVLGQVNNPPKIDGYVTAGEWPGYDLKSDLMVLSACETGLGKTVAGEGVMGLPYAFYVAGNKNTVLTLWSISDQVTVEFITRFFTKLKAGQKQIKALTATKREFLHKGGRYANPKYWAAFVLYGV